MRRLPISIVLALCALAAAGRAQNLVPNPTFDNYSQCPSSFAQMNRCNAWSTPTAGSPEYYHACSSGVVDVPSNAYGNQAAHAGSAYVGIICYNTTSGEFREYVEAQLSSPLVANQQYEVSFWVSLADSSRWKIADIGAYFSAGSVGFVNTQNPLPYTPQVANPSTNIISNTTGWTQISGTFTAAGGETHIVIGNFKNNASTNVQQAGGSSVWGYYYVDDVSVKQVSTGGVVCTNHVVGWADLPAPATTSFIDIQDIDGGCKPADTICKPTQPLRAPVFYGGGTAYDPRYQAVWVSDGNVLADYLVNPQSACKQRCGLSKAAKLDPQAIVSGLAHTDRVPRLLHLATRPGYMEVVTYDNRKCPVRRTGCKRTLPAKTIAAGLAVDEIRGFVYVSLSTQTAPGSWSNLLWVTTLQDPCKPICEARILTCSKSPALGLAYDACKQLLYATDGQLTQTIGVVDPKGCKLKIGGCCKKQINPVWRGLAVIPGWKKKTVGQSCTTQPCASCTSMEAGCQGDPGIGNNFVLDIRNAPTNGFGMLFLKAGACGTGIALPAPFCGTWYPFPSILTYPAVPLTGVAPCGGRRAWTLPIPAIQGLCGRTLCAQWFVFCPGAAGWGVGVTNAIEFTITGT